MREETSTHNQRMNGARGEGAVLGKRSKTNGSQDAQGAAFTIAHRDIFPQ